MQASLQKEKQTKNQLIHSLLDLFERCRKLLSSVVKTLAAGMLIPARRLRGIMTCKQMIYSKDVEIC